jgi:hypothetical protein
LKYHTVEAAPLTIEQAARDLRYGLIIQSVDHVWCWQPSPKVVDLRLRSLILQKCRI